MRRAVLFAIILGVAVLWAFVPYGEKGGSGAPGEAGAVQPVKVRSGKGVAPAW
jgi:hypothetical protein